MPIGSILGGLISQGGAQAAGPAAGAAGNQAYNNSVNLGNQDNALLSPYTSSGREANNALSQIYGLGPVVQSGDMYGDYGTATGQGYGTQGAKDAQQNAFTNFQSFPGYQFALDQGRKTVENSGSARGMTLSGAQDQALNKYGQGVASQGFGDYVGGLRGISGQGQAAAGTIGSLRNQAELPGIQAQFQGGMAQANSYQNSANALASGISGGINSLATIGAFGLGGGFGGGDAGGGAATGNYGYGSAAPSTSFGPFAGFKTV